ncbi:APC family permease [Agromyces subbeticus]|uniref:APC family permease n=1 Tax=Agromyces subbeticus TaxID=293890 RepID=UPI0003B606FA|nr:APC family permease [Agromyces subbeticus]
MAETPTLKRSLGLWAIVALGLGYMAPVTVFDTFGIVSGETDGVVPMAYLVAIVVMLFTAISYGKMVSVFPTAGSAYTYTRKTMSPTVGFLVGWVALMDYLLLPLVNAVIVRIYMEGFFPEVPGAVWVIGFVALITALNIRSIKSTSRTNLVMLMIALIGIAAFLVLAAVQISNGLGEGTLLTTQPLWHDGVQMNAVLAGTTVVAFSFIGFDAVTMYTEEAKDPRLVPKAIALTVLIGGGIFFLGAWFAQVAFPTLEAFQVTDDTLPELALFVGGTVFQALFVAAALAAAIASAVSSQASVSRLLYVMGRNGVLAPKRLFSYVHPKLRTPVFTTLLVGVVCLAAIAPSLELISSMINFGALIAFTFVNLSVIAYFVVRKRRYHTAKDVFSFIVLPLIGAATTGLLWVNLHADALIAGAVWLGIGVIYLIFLTRGFRKPVASLGIDETDDLEDEPMEPTAAQAAPRE